MARKSFASSARATRRAKNAGPIPDSRIDLSDIPEASDAELRRARRVGRPASGNAKQLIAIRIAPKLLDQLRRMAAKQCKPYQTLIHELLEKAARKVA
jgi:predicted DNA binding CopG/RHH family protein